ncbi:hypothetical protein Tsp_15207, partial [Trichinella spiralis]|uniref:hypothetical protein n=1 Tax=Trichinella spiralis TaxID=6334 RepID=UPI0001EFE2C4
MVRTWMAWFPDDDWRRDHSNPNLSVVEKFNLFKRLIWECRNCYSGIDSECEHLKSSQNLPVITNQWDSKRLEKFVNDMEIHIRGLETLNTPPVVYQAVLMPLILSRLPREISVEWKRQNPNRQKDMYELLSFLKTELKSREVPTFPRRERNFVSPFPPNRKTVPRGQYTTAALQTTVRKACFICGKDHALENCPKKNGEHQEAGIVLLILKKSHLVATCKAKLRCRVEECSKRHHPLIHLNQERRS